MKQTAVTFLDHKQKGEKISMLTAYDYSTAKLIDQSGIDGILVGDSLGNVMLGYEDTLSVTVEDMIHHGAAVARGVKNALVVIDMPFLSYQTSVYDAVKNAGRLVKEGHAGAVKLEGGEEFAPQIRAITAASIPVMGHLGLTPQSIHTLGGYRVQGKTEAAAQKLLEDALAVEEAGAFALTLECVPAKLAELITSKLSIPTIGIGAGAGCDGQILVYQDMLGTFTDYTPKFVKRFADVGEVMKNAFAEYNRQVKEGAFPDEAHSFGIDEEVLKKLY
ncbi:MAG TPA: 3-methyl-2-oxobutanoate hydroxymethyltransferase [Candidatus Egerieicola pullicola]|uniref:3-methyl-2-oxobutanoate hydroxymethyltransferase n=1 Tax=Candidatus Egerieicola pullicola TaxID=2840775 RepID=A0A9D1AJI0_9FIRM|nr:3-methyl-2-oxobutanoate hydroxymethyltransferase [Candidatus Egerieicola pullicola]